MGVWSFEISLGERLFEIANRGVHQVVGRMWDAENMSQSIKSGDLRVKYEKNVSVYKYKY